MKENLEFQLDEALEISKGGKFEKTGTITIKPPSMDSHNAVCDFEQLFMGSMISAGNMFKGILGDGNEEEDESALEKLKNHTPSAEEIRMMVTVSQDVKLTKLFQAFKTVACKDGLVDEGLKMKESYFGKLSRNDSLRMMCEYAAFFTFPSLLGGKSESSNGEPT